MTRRAVAILLTPLAALAVTGCEFRGVAEQPDAPQPERAFVGGSFRQINSKEGSAVLMADGLKPGDSRTGTVRITNGGELPGDFTLTESKPADASGPNGGLLSQRLDLLVEDVTAAGHPLTVYSGKLDSMGASALGKFAAGESRVYRFSVTLPDGGVPASDLTGDNAYQGSSTSIEFDWTASAAESSEETPAATEQQAAPDTVHKGSHLRLAGRTRQILRPSGLVMRARCWRPCTLVAWGTLDGRKAEVARMAPSANPTGSATWTTLRLRFPPRAMRAVEERLARTMWLRMRVTAEAVDPRGETVSLSRTVELRRPLGPARR
jgi:hypothetical protein